MLRATSQPFFFAASRQRTAPKLSQIVSNAFSHSPPTVRENASTTSLAITRPHQRPPASAYIHLPFCRKRCHYCDFPIVALGSSLSQTDEDDPRISNYIQLLCREIEATRTGFSHPAFLETVFFGGGTPSLVPPKLVSSVLDLLRLKFGLCFDAEISMEMDPGTFDAKKMEELVELGVNRVSLGVQAFQDEMLKGCGRAHGVEEVYEAIDVVKSCGIENWSMDLISSLPYHTPEMWEQSLHLTIEAQPTHVSVYDLQVEQGTKFGTLFTPGEFPLPSEIQSADFYRMASRILSSAGYNHYEISSYCKNGFECKHNLTYWRNQPFYGFGLGSASYVGGVRFSRPKKIRGYMEYVHKVETGVVDCSGDSRIDAKDMATDVVMLALRTARGLDLKSFRGAFGDSLVLSLCKTYRPYVESGHVIFLDEQSRAIAAKEFDSLMSNEQERKDVLAFLRLSDPSGFLLSNELISLAFGVIAP